MGNLTLAIPDELQKKMRQHTEIRWSEVVRKAIEQKVEDLNILDKLTKKSKLTKKDVAEISKKIDVSAARKLGLYDSH